MKTIASVALAGGLAAALAAAAIAPASAHDWRPPPPRSHNWHPGAGAGFATGAAIGLAYGAFAAPYAAPYYGPPAYAYYPPAPPPPVAYGWSEHVNWCAAQYNTYDPSTDSWVDYYGVAHRCVGP